ncbi:MAG: short chain dehydrogenase [Bacteroidetes bacterium]|nr:MAG: short chain dehydrogenase [Bacteroidota bacterium]
MKDKVVIITGGSSGIGEALAYKFATYGTKVVIGARNTEALEKVVATIIKNGGDAVWLQTDVTSETDCKNLVLKAVDSYGKVDILINNAGVSMRAIFNDLKLEVFNRVIDVNFWSAVYCTKYAMPYLLKQNGSVVGVSSAGGIKGLPGRSAYSASKFAMNGFMESLRTENLKTGLHVLMAFPGFTASNIRNAALGADGNIQGESPRNEDKMMTAEEVATHIYKAVIHRKNKIVLTRQGKLINVLGKIFPGWTDKMIFKGMAKEPGSPF